jgi:hypothetical protein
LCDANLHGASISYRGEGRVVGFFTCDKWGKSQAVL